MYQLSTGQHCDVYGSCTISPIILLSQAQLSCQQGPHQSIKHPNLVSVPGSMCGPKHFPSMKEIFLSFLNSDVLPNHVMKRLLSGTGGPALKAVEAFQRGPGCSLSVIATLLGSHQSSSWRLGFGVWWKKTTGQRANVFALQLYMRAFLFLSVK